MRLGFWFWTNYLSGSRLFWLSFSCWLEENEKSSRINNNKIYKTDQNLSGIWFFWPGWNQLKTKYWDGRGSELTATHGPVRLGFWTHATPEVEPEPGPGNITPEPKAAAQKWMTAGFLLQCTLGDVVVLIQTWRHFKNISKIKTLVKLQLRFVWHLQRNYGKNSFLRWKVSERSKSRRLNILQMFASSASVWLEYRFWCVFMPFVWTTGGNSRSEPVSASRRPDELVKNGILRRFERLSVLNLPDSAERRAEEMKYFEMLRYTSSAGRSGMLVFARVKNAIFSLESQKTFGSLVTNWLTSWSESGNKS